MREERCGHDGHELLIHGGLLGGSLALRRRGRGACSCHGRACAGANGGRGRIEIAASVEVQRAARGPPAWRVKISAVGAPCKGGAHQGQPTRAAAAPLEMARRPTQDPVASPTAS